MATRTKELPHSSAATCTSDTPIQESAEKHQLMLNIKMAKAEVQDISPTEVKPSTRIIIEYICLKVISQFKLKVITLDINIFY